jgi:hypothetical protein
MTKESAAKQTFVDAIPAGMRRSRSAEDMEFDGRLSLRLRDGTIFPAS